MLKRTNCQSSKSFEPQGLEPRFLFVSLIAGDKSPAYPIRKNSVFQNSVQRSKTAALVGGDFSCRFVLICVQFDESGRVCAEDAGGE